MLPLPKIALVASEYPRLEQLARRAAQRGDLDGIFLLGEINRADIVPDEWDDLGSRVIVGSWVTFCTNWGVPRRIVQLVWPEEMLVGSRPHFGPDAFGAALIGLQVGDQMPYFVAGCLNVVRVLNVTRSSPNVVPLFPANRRSRPLDDDPGPTAA